MTAVAQDSSSSSPPDRRASDRGRRIRIAIVENHQVVSDGLRMLVDDQPDMDVIGVASSVAGVTMLPRDPSPDVVLIDLHLNDGTGNDVAMVIRVLHPSARLIFLSRDEGEDAVAAAVAAGANAFVPKSRAASEVIDAIRQTADGISLITPGIVASALSESRKRDAIRDRITEREQRVLELMNAGLSTRQIAERLSISYSTVRSHIRAIECKLDAHSKVGAVVTARDLDLVD